MWLHCQGRGAGVWCRSFASGWFWIADLTKTYAIGVHVQVPRPPSADKASE